MIGKKSVLTSLTSRLNALRKVCRVATFKQRKIIADGIVMSKLIYIIQLWGGCSKYLIYILQKLRNKAARFVTKLEWSTHWF